MPPGGSQTSSGNGLAVKAEPREPAPLTNPSSAVYPPQPGPSQEFRPLLSYPHSPPGVQIPLPSPHPPPPSTRDTPLAPVVVKPETAEEQRIEASSSQLNNAPQSNSKERDPELPQAIPPMKVKPEPGTQPEPEPQLQIDVTPEIPMTYTSAKEINYTPESALAACTQAAATVENHLKELDLGELRRNIWFRDIESFKSQSTPRTMVAVCGATGAGKSSLLNAVLDDNIVPTSGMRACTSVVTEIGYHDKDSILAEVEFLARPEWSSEIEILLDYLVEENGKPKRPSETRTDAGIAWAKMHAVYPNLTAEHMVKMTPDQIIDSKPEVARILGTTECIECPDSEKFGSEITKYVDSKDPKRGKDKQKKSAGDRPKGDEPALWPLIRLVRVRAKSKALSGGAILVDLPGVADANLARSSIAKEYMKRCDCIWITAAITRAVDDKTAKDLLGEAFRTQLLNGNYDAGFITFIATKTDDLSCTEVIGALGLYDDPELVEVEEKLDVEQAELEGWTAKAKSATKEMRGELMLEIDAALGGSNSAYASCSSTPPMFQRILQRVLIHDPTEMETAIKKLTPLLDKYKDQLRALMTGRPFEPILTAPRIPGEGSPKKRKKSSGGRMTKRARVDSDDNFAEDDSMDLDNNDTFINDRTNIQEVNTDAEDALVEKALDQDVIVIDSDSDEVIILTDSDDPDDHPTAKVTPKATPTSYAEECVKKSIQDTEAKIRELSKRRDELKDTQKEAGSKVNLHKKAAFKLQKEKNAFCSKKRNDYSKDALKEHFRLGLKELDQAEEETKNPETFDPSVDIRDYNAINLPVFTCSSRDYIRIKKQVKGDGDPICFVNPEDTEVPALQEWCHQLTLSSRERSARTLLHNLTTFLHSVKPHVVKMEGVNVADRQALAKLWESTVNMVQVDDSLGLTQAQLNPPPAPPAFPIPPSMRRGHRRNMSSQPAPDTSLNGMAERAKRILAQARYALPLGGKGISFRLRQNMKKVAASCVEQLKQAFHEGIKERCQLGAGKARESAVEVSDTFASSMHWQSYRAALRRNGEWKDDDLNTDLVGPMTREIAASWARVFGSDLFAPTARAGHHEITNLLKEVQVSAPSVLNASCEVQSQLALKEAEGLTTNLLQNLKSLMTNEQKDISRCLAPHIQRELLTTYQSASAECGPGSVARQKQLFHNHVETSRGTIFSKGTETLFEKLDQAAELIGVLLELGLSELAEKIEVNMSVLWDIPKASKSEAQKRLNLIQHIDDTLKQLEMWLAASKRSETTDNYTEEPIADGQTGVRHSEGPDPTNITRTFPDGTYATGTNVDECMDADEEDEEDEEEDGDEDHDELGDEDGSGESDEDGAYY